MSPTISFSSESADGSALTDRLRNHVQRLAGDIGERNVWRPKALRAAADYIRGEFAELGYEVAIQSYQAEGLGCDNIEVEIGRAHV